MRAANASAHRGGHTGGIIWTPHPPKPPSPRRLRRAAEWGLLLELGTQIAECWWDRATAQADGSEAITVLLALTRWWCSIELPQTSVELNDEVPLFDRRRVAV